MKMKNVKSAIKAQQKTTMGGLDFINNLKFLNESEIIREEDLYAKLDKLKLTEYYQDQLLYHLLYLADSMKFDKKRLVDYFDAFTSNPEPMKKMNKKKEYHSHYNNKYRKSLKLNRVLSESPKRMQKNLFPSIR
mmetsp:Transcript_12236/g.10848  ORF Transcript_12236/g.10848 Transcript_12236/m.10848 type:complete len:134 (+) Transcript_12236:1183-1584(+)